MLTPKESRRKAEVLLVSMRYPLTVIVTCETCEENAECDYAFDPYNMEGDCLAIK